MSFQVGDPVTPVVNITFSGMELPTAGVSGVVLARTLFSFDNDNNALYTYNVQLSSGITVGSGSDIQTSIYFFFSEQDLGNTVSARNLIDASGLSDTMNTGLSNFNTGFGQVGSIAQSIPVSSSYYDQVSKYLEALIDSNTALTTFSGSSSDPILNTFRTESDSADKLGFDALIFKELAENAAGFHDVLSEISDEQAQIKAEVDQQNVLAAEDDAANQQVYFDTFVYTDAAESLFTPLDTPSDFSTEDNTVTETNPDNQLKDTLPTDLLDRLRLRLN